MRPIRLAEVAGETANDPKDLIAGRVFEKAKPKFDDWKHYLFDETNAKIKEHLRCNNSKFRTSPSQQPTVKNLSPNKGMLKKQPSDKTSLPNASNDYFQHTVNLLKKLQALKEMQRFLQWRITSCGACRLVNFMSAEHCVGFFCKQYREGY